MAFQSFACSSGGDAGDAERHRMLMSPQVDQSLRMAVQFCWMALPKEKRNPEEVERQLRRLLDRALRDLREDAAEFGIDGDA